MFKVNRQGQAAVELLTVFGLVLMPFGVAVGLYYRINWEKTKCVYQSFNEARERLVQTDQTVSLQKSCGDTEERLTLLPLETLDQNKDGLDLQDFRTQVSRSWDQFSSLQSH